MQFNKKERVGTTATLGTTNWRWSKMKQKIIVTQAIFPDLLKALEADFDVISNQENLPLSADELEKHLASVDGALVSGMDYIRTSYSNF